MKRFIKTVNLISEWTGQAVKWLVLVLIVTVSYDVFMRYVLNKPTIWSFTLSYMIGGTFFVIGQPYLQKYKGNVRVDILYNKLSKKAKLLLDIISSSLLFFPVYFLLTRTFWNDFIRSFQRMEVDISTTWYPPLWPFKLIVAIGFTLFLIQFVADILEGIFDYLNLRTKGVDEKC